MQNSRISKRSLISHSIRVIYGCSLLEVMALVCKKFLSCVFPQRIRHEHKCMNSSSRRSRDVEVHFESNFRSIKLLYSNTDSTRLLPVVKEYHKVNNMVTIVSLATRHHCSTKNELRKQNCQVMYKHEIKCLTQFTLYLSAPYVD